MKIKDTVISYFALNDAERHISDPVEERESVAETDPVKKADPVEETASDNLWLLNACEVKYSLGFAACIIEFLCALTAFIVLIANRQFWCLLAVPFAVEGAGGIENHLRCKIIKNGNQITITLPNKKGVYAVAVKKQWIAYNIKSGYTFRCDSLPAKITVSRIIENAKHQKKSQPLATKTIRP